jgi:hypothetical protein
MKGLFKLTLLFVMSVLGVCSTCLYGAGSGPGMPSRVVKGLHLIPIAFRPEVREYYILLRKPHDSINFVPFTAFVHSLLDVDDVSEYMRQFSQQTFGVYPPYMVPLTHSKRAFTNEGTAVNEQSLEGYIFIEVPFIAGGTLFRKAIRQRPGSDEDFAWIPVSTVSTLREGEKYSPQVEASEFGIGNAIEVGYLRLLKLMIPKLQEMAKLQKVLHILPVSYDPSAKEFSVLLIQPGSRGVYKAITVNFDPSQESDYTALCARGISEQTYRAYGTDIITQPAHIGQVFNAKGEPVKNEDVEGYVYIEVPYLRGQHIWQAAAQYLGMDPGINYNWVPRSVIEKISKSQNIPRGNGPINETLLDLLKKTLPLLEHRQGMLILRGVGER